ncbi:Leucine-rich repeat-containing protein 47-like [Oopsacas minuta]|uniref:Leucine-rich repeat-containing protein 47-like n=1 Tax=Oopsacas minuta TaxID=111878 RepID=A0AAV7JSK4_9METZ|nr:Leucine-rich repeat-containing protein 47-like [Oopsacas minuta]
MLDSKHTVSLSLLTAAREGKKRELSADFGKKEYSDSELDNLLEALFKIHTLNDLSITRLPLTELREEFYSLSNLLRLSVTSGVLTEISPSINHLQQIKYLDFSQNKLTSLPSEIYSLYNLALLNVSSNELTSLPDSPHSQLLPTLTAINLGHNLIENFPIPLLYMSAVTELDIPSNSLVDIPPAIHYLNQLRRINAKDNKITGLPNELSKCKIKCLSFESNPIKDRKLKKLIEQHGATKPKSVLDYLKANVPESKDEQLPKPRSMVLKELSKVPKYAAVVKQGTDWILEMSDVAREYRCVYCCCIVKNIDLSNKVTLSQFLKLQADIHASELSKNRQLCTVGTHDVSAIQFPLKLIIESSINSKLQPLGCDYVMSAFDFLKLVERENMMKQGDHGYLNRYINLLKSTEHICYLQDSNSTVLSMPPITNCTVSMLQQKLGDVFIEVSSDKSVYICRKAMEVLLTGMLQSGISSVSTADSSLSPEGATAPTMLGAQQFGCLEVEQVRVVNGTGGLVGVYPGRSDLVGWEVKWC